MAQGGMIGNGVKIAYAATSPTTWVAVGQILNVEIPQLVADKIDRTVHSTNRYKRSLPGMIDVSDHERGAAAAIAHLPQGGHDDLLAN